MTSSAAVLDEISNAIGTLPRIVLIIQISFKLGLRAQEMALLRVREIAALGDEFACGYEIKDVLVLPKSFHWRMLRCWGRFHGMWMSVLRSSQHSC